MRDAAQASPPRFGAFFEKANDFFELSLTFRSRLILLAGALILLLSYLLPLYQMTLYANQFPDGLILEIYSYGLVGGKTPSRDDLQEINILNHYIGMRPLDEHDFSEFRWIPLATGAFVILALRAVVFGKMSKLVDVLVMFLYFGLFSAWSFYQRLFQYGHELDPTASVKVQPFTPPVFGMKQLANFTVYNYPGLGSYVMVIFAAALIIALWLSARHPAESRQ
jgi:hypothetical protein